MLLEGHLIHHLYLVYLKHCKEPGSFLPNVPLVEPWAFKSEFPVEAALWLWPTDMPWVEAVWTRSVQTLWELEWVGVFLSIWPLPQPLCLELFSALAGWLSCSALLRAAINLAIWLLSSIEPSTNSVISMEPLKCNRKKMEDDQMPTLNVYLLLIIFVNRIFKVGLMWVAFANVKWLPLRG